MWSKIKFLLVALSLSGNLLVVGSNPVTAASCLDQVSDFAIRICGEIANSGTKTVVDASGNVQAGVSDIIRNVVGGASTNLNGHVLYDTYTGVVRDQLGAAQFNVIDCRQKMVNVAVAQVCNKRSETNVCMGNGVGLRVLLTPMLFIIVLHIGVWEVARNSLLILLNNVFARMTTRPRYV
jgi:hypothetical protein